MLEHSFGAGDQKWSVGFMPHVGFPRTDMALIGPKGWDTGRDATAIMTLRPSGATFRGESEVVTLEGGAILRRISVENALLDAIPANTEMEVSTKQRPPVSFALPAPAQATAALKSCGEKLLQSWGVDPARFRPVMAPGQPGFIDLSKYLSADDYPASHAAGKTATLLSITADGKVKACRVIESSGKAELDSRTCEIALSRLHYPPMRDAAGQNVESWTMLAIRWAAR